MKLKYKFQIVPLDDGFVGVPVSENAEELHGTLELNDVAAQMLRRIGESETPEEAHELLCQDFPEEDKDAVGQELCDFLNQLVREGLLVP